MIQKWVLASYFYSCDIGRILPWLFAFLVMGGFVTLYNYIGFRLLAPPFNLSQTAPRCRNSATRLPHAMRVTS